MGRTVPISAGQPPDTTRTAAGQVVTLAAAQAVAMQAAASRTLAALLRPLTRAARAVAGQAGPLGRWLPPCPRGHQDLPPLPPAFDRRAARPAPALARFLTGAAEAGVYGPPGRVGPEYLPGRARLAAPVLAVRSPGGPAQGFLGQPPPEPRSCRYPR